MYTVDDRPVANIGTVIRGNRTRRILPIKWAIFKLIESDEKFDAIFTKTFSPS